LKKGIYRYTVIREATIKASLKRGDYPAFASPPYLWKTTNDEGFKVDKRSSAYSAECGVRRGLRSNVLQVICHPVPFGWQHSDKLFR
jgi:hypothetical protein